MLDLVLSAAVSMGRIRIKAEPQAQLRTYLPSLEMNLHIPSNRSYRNRCFPIIKFYLLKHLWSIFISFCFYLVDRTWVATKTKKYCSFTDT